MINEEKLSGECVYSSSAIQSHLHKLVSDPLFSYSDILKRFLDFIVQETLEGRSDQLKEYTIGVKVLHKPVTFNPQTDAIVRIHACRLRRALNRYYEKESKADGLRIAVPKGNYIPFFYESLPPSPETEKKSRLLNEPKKINRPAYVVTAVLPFGYSTKQEIIASMAEGMTIQLSSELAHLPNLSVIASNLLRLIDDRPHYLRELVLKAGAEYLITGDLQSQDNRVRINVQIINALTYEQVWSHLYEYFVSENNVFEIQDDLVKKIITQFENFRKSKKTLVTKNSSLAVA